MSQRYKVKTEGMQWVAGVRPDEEGFVRLTEKAAAYDLARGNIEPAPEVAPQAEEAAPLAEVPALPAKKTREG